MLPAILHGLALLLAMCIQTVETPIAGAWFWILLLGCFALLREGHPKRSVGWYAAVVWILTLGNSCFIFSPLTGGSAVFWMLAAMPMLAVCLHKKHLKPYIISFGLVLFIYASGLIAQKMLDVHYTLSPDISPSVHSGWSWPLLDSNNAAAVINAGVIGSLWITLKRGYKWSILFIYFLYALALTHSRAGFISAGAACFLMLYAQKYYRVCLTALLSIPVFIYSLIMIRPEAVLSAAESFSIRGEIWHSSWPLVWLRPYIGLGLGSFSFYYAQVRKEIITGGIFAHNDLLQFAIEMGVPALCVFVFLALVVVVTTRRCNAPAAAYLGAVFLMATAEFQFYVPPVAMLMGLALAYHRLTYCDNRNIIPLRR